MYSTDVTKKLDLPARQDAVAALERIVLACPDEELLIAAFCEVRVIVPYPAVVAATAWDLYVGFAHDVTGVRRTLHRISIDGITKVGQRRVPTGPLVVRGSHGTWRFDRVEPAGRAVELAEFLAARCEPRPGGWLRPGA